MTSAPRAYADTIRALGGPEVSPREIVAVWHIRPTQVVLEHFLGRQISPHYIELFHRCFAAVVATVEAFPGVVEMLDALSGGVSPCTPTLSDPTCGNAAFPLRRCGRNATCMVTPSTTGGLTWMKG